jgi:hypothetical protein
MNGASHPVGSLGSTRSARVDARGGISVERSAIALEWWVGADDRWHCATSEPAVRQRRLGAAPVYETSMRIPSGDALQRVYGIGGTGDPIIVEIENDSPAPVALALVVRGVHAGTDLTQTSVVLDRALQIHATKPAARVVVAADPVALLATIEAGGAGDASPSVVPDGTGALALLQPLAHRTRCRFALVLDPERVSEIDLVGAPGAGDAALGWDAVLRRGMQVVFADPGPQAATDRARADVLLEAARENAGPEVFAALEDWGFDAEAVGVWRRLGWRARRRAARRRFGPATDAGSSATQVLRSTRDAVIAERRNGAIVLAPEPPVPGEPLEVHNAPTRSGAVSYALRWHGPRVAVLWDVQPQPDSVHLIAPSLDPEWSTDEPSGEVLLGGAPITAAGA